MIVLFGQLFVRIFSQPHGEPLNAGLLVTETAQVPDELTATLIMEHEYSVFSNGEFIGGFEIFDEAAERAKSLDRATVKRRGGDTILWDNLPPFLVYTTNEDYREFGGFADALEYGKSRGRSLIVHRKSREVVWDSYSRRLESHQIGGVEKILQNPELPRGCEVTSLAMFLNFLGKETDKMRLAEEVAKDFTPYSRINGKIHYGNPNTGFVGSMTDMKKNGLGVYHGPVYDLALTYLPDTAIDATGCELSDLYLFLSKDIPVWVIVTSVFRELPPNDFETWQTAAGDVKITYSEHSVLLTGYDAEYIYFNNPLPGVQKSPVSEFEAAWIQMGRQAVTAAKR